MLRHRLEAGGTGVIGTTLVCLALLMTASSALGFPGEITTVAGFGINDGGPLTEAGIGGAWHIHLAANGDIYLADWAIAMITKANAATDTYEHLIGNGIHSPNLDAASPQDMSLGRIQNVGADSNGDVYFRANFSRIYKLDVSAGTVSEVTDADGNPIVANRFITDHNDNLYYYPYGTTIEKLDLATGAVTQAVPSLDDDDPMVSGIAVDASGNIYWTDLYDHVVRMHDVTTETTTIIAGSGVQGFSGDEGPATEASFNQPRGIYVDDAGNIFIGDTYNQRVRKVDAATGFVTTYAGGGPLLPALADGGPATQASLSMPIGVQGDASGNVFFSDRGNQRIRRVDPSGIITTVVGGHVGDGGAATDASFSGKTTDLHVNGSGNITIADRVNLRIRLVDGVSGLISTLAGNGEQGTGGDGGPATDAQLQYPNGLAVDDAGSAYIADVSVRKVDAATGRISTVAGGPDATDAGDGGLAANAALYAADVALDSDGDMYISDWITFSVRKVNSLTGIITTVAGNGSPVASGDGGPATKAGMTPLQVFVAPNGDLYISDYNNNRVRKVDTATGTITTVVAGIARPIGLFLDGGGNLFIAESGRHQIRKVDPSGMITTVAGTGTAGYFGDGVPATETGIGAPHGVFVDNQGDLYLLDSGEFRVRKVEAAGVPTTLAAGVYLGPVEGLAAQVEALVSDGAIKRGPGKGLIAKVEGAQSKMDKGHAIAAANQLEAFINQVNGLIPKKLSQAEGQPLIDQANAIIASLGLPATKPVVASAGNGLSQASPNPFNPMTQIRYSTVEPGQVRLVIYSSLGQAVRTLVSGHQGAGSHQVTWDGRDDLGRAVSSGIYLYRMVSGGFIATRSMVLLK